MDKTDKLIIDARLNEYTFREPNPNIPYSPEEIAADAEACVAAGASIVHYHARDPETGAPSSDPGLYAETVRAIRARCDAIIMPTLGANTVTDLDERIGHIEAMAKDDATRADVLSCLEERDRQRFAPQGGDPEAKSRFLERVGGLMTRLDKAIR